MFTKIAEWLKPMGPLDQWLLKHNLVPGKRRKK